MGLVLGLVLFSHGEVAAQALDKDQQKCSNAMNKSMQKLGSTVGKDFNACVKNYGKGKTDKLGPGGTPDACLLADQKGKIAKTTGKLETSYIDKCSEPLPPYGVTDPNNMIRTALDQQQYLLRDIFGVGMEEGLSQEPATAKCQDAAFKAALKCLDTRMKEFNSCAKAEMKNGASNPGDIAACIGRDDKGKIAKACDAKLSAGVLKKCPTNAMAQSFAGCGAADVAGLIACLQDATECRACQAAKAGDNLTDHSCGCFHTVCPVDTNAFCIGGDNDGEPCTSTVAHLDCPPGPPAARCIGETNFLMNTVDAQPQLSFVPEFDMHIDCSEADPVTGNASCTCDLLNIQPIDLSELVVGWVCIDSFPGCPAGDLDCDGGTPLDISSAGNHTVGVQCGLFDDPNGGDDPNNYQGPEECSADCADYCDGLGGGYQVAELMSGCEGYCRFGSREGLPCGGSIGVCPDGRCIGGDNPPHPNKCNCVCVEVAGDPSPPGTLSCQAGVSVEVEAELPCDSTDVVLAFGRQCVPITSAAAEGELINANAFPGHTIPSPERIGVGASCAALQSGNASGLVTVGNMLFWEAGIGDTLVGITFDCE
jgi:hypothetical protein